MPDVCGAARRERHTVRGLSCRHDVAHGIRSEHRRPRDQDEQVGAGDVGRPVGWRREQLTSPRSAAVVGRG